MGFWVVEMKENEEWEALVTLFLAELFDDKDEDKNDGSEMILLLFCAQSDELFEFGDGWSHWLLLELTLFPTMNVRQELNFQRTSCRVSMFGFVFQWWWSKEIDYGETGMQQWLGDHDWVWRDHWVIRSSISLTGKHDTKRIIKIFGACLFERRCCGITDSLDFLDSLAISQGLWCVVLFV